MFRYKRAVPVSYDRQGYIYFLSRAYKGLPEAEQQRIRKACREAGGEHEKALFAFVTSDMGQTAVCSRYYISQSTLERIVRKYYVRMDGEL